MYFILKDKADNKKLWCLLGTWQPSNQPADSWIHM